ncbi:SUKH-4 family immunity protein [Streptomyces cyaneochromogenes]|uniref:SUKH-4 family immunity protein n=1 Tax=Streptomyces cyaneochromogenes TaxID=2496836 RepID=UPI00158B2EF1|nr:SUKH-4 family immunity protein [Streptomyces cyaneochromogenes]
MSRQNDRSGHRRNPSQRPPGGPDFTHAAGPAGPLPRHTDSRTFLAHIGIPRAEGVLFEIRGDLADGLTPLLSHRPTAGFSTYQGAPADFTDWVQLGKAVYSDIALDGASGIVYGMWPLEKRRTRFPSQAPPKGQRRRTCEDRPHNIFTSFITWIGNRPGLQLTCL